MTILKRTMYYSILILVGFGIGYYLTPAESNTQIGPFTLGFDPSIAPTVNEPIEITITWPNKITLNCHKNRPPKWNSFIYINGMSHPGRIHKIHTDGTKTEIPSKSNPIECEWNKR